MCNSKKTTHVSGPVVNVFTITNWKCRTPNIDSVGISQWFVCYYIKPAHYVTIKSYSSVISVFYTLKAFGIALSYSRRSAEFVSVTCLIPMGAVRLKLEELESKAKSGAKAIESAVAFKELVRKRQNVRGRHSILMYHMIDNMFTKQDTVYIAMLNIL